MKTWSVSVEGGVYELTFHEDGRATARRHGEEWRDVTGDSLIRALALEVKWWRDRLDPVLREAKALTKRVEEVDRSSKVLAGIPLPKGLDRF